MRDTDRDIISAGPYLIGKRLFSPITNVKIWSSLDPPAGGVPSEPGWHYYDMDLNKGADGNFIYLGIQREDGTPIRQLTFLTYDEQKNVNPLAPWGWEWDPHDLNEGADGVWIYTFWHRAGDPAVFRPITELHFEYRYHDEDPPNVDGFKVIPVDLNEGCGWNSAFIWCYITDRTESDLIRKRQFSRVNGSKR